MPRGIYIRTPENTAKLRLPKSAETKARMSAAKMGHPATKWQTQAVVGYQGVHYRVRTILVQACVRADETCKGRIEAALRHGLPTELLRYDKRYGTYYIGNPAIDGYTPMCQSHHSRYDQNHRPPA